MSRDLTPYKRLKKDEYNIVAGSTWPSFEEFQQHNNIADFIYDEIDSMLWNLAPKISETFCVLPFYGIEYPDNVPCCIMGKVNNLDEIREQMLAGEKPKACATCWKLESAGVQSDRQLKNTTLDFYLKEDIKLLFDRAVEKKNSVIHYKIDTSNTCNATCITCSGNCSSAWAILEKKNGVDTFATQWKLTPGEVDKMIDYSTVKMIGFRGGEPLLSDTNFYILEKLVEHNNTDCFISFTTNGSMAIRSSQKDLLKQFKNVNFCFSIDGVGPVFEYLRYPLKWNQLLENIDYCRNNGITVSASYTISNINVFYHAETVAWFKENGIEFLNNPVSYPAYFRPSALSESIKQGILKTNTDPLLTMLLGQHTAKDDVDYQSAKQKIAEQDSWKKIQMTDYLPEFSRYFLPIYS
ncbi:Radical_SAM domain containing protein [uncultured Caudovirales phage]|uniref:Radical_SAM domain containing protein n=1 Tax=uncultured Caudovirales phage TaxID=2100421 RepID=A0A6J5L673_9CAUD|nr:Radical_SAM domain containing protein [uncultured Caudovirales phage]